MITKWTDHLKTDEEKDRFRNSVNGSKAVLERLDNILLTMKENAEANERNTKTYDIPNWDYRQAHINGFMDCLHKIRLTIDLDQENNDRPIR